MNTNSPSSLVSTDPHLANWPEVPWKTWQPQQECVLCFVIQDGQVLLIEKKTGFGAGKVNGPGGKVDPGETTYEAAIREAQEEISVTPEAPREIGVLSFQFADGYAMRCTVFRADDFSGVPTESEEARPFWVGVENIPFEAMWQDDRHWFPYLLSERYFKAFFAFDGDVMLNQRIDA